MSWKDIFIKTEGSEEGTATPVAVSTPSSAPQVITTQSFVTGVAHIDPEVLAQTRAATFEIAGSVYARFAVESKKLEAVVIDPTIRINAVIALLGSNPNDLVTALSTTHRGALNSWKDTVAKAKDASQKEKIGGRELQLQGIIAEDTRIQGEISRLQQQLQNNANKAATLRNEIASEQAIIDAKAKQYDAAIAATEAELTQIINTLQ